MSILAEAQARCDTSDLVIMMIVERLRHTGEPAHATAVAAHINGAPIAEVDRVMDRLVVIGVLDRVAYVDEATQRRPKAYCVNSLGAEVLDADVEGWTCSELEQTRRDAMMRSAQAGRMS